MSFTTAVLCCFFFLQLGQVDLFMDPSEAGGRGFPTKWNIPTLQLTDFDGQTSSSQNGSTWKDGNMVVRPAIPSNSL